MTVANKFTISLFTPPDSEWVPIQRSLGSEKAAIKFARKYEVTHPNEFHRKEDSMEQSYLLIEPEGAV